VVNRSLVDVVGTRWRLLAGRSERGSAMVEFHFLGIVLMMPLVYILIAVFSAQSATYGVTQAAREAGRVFVASGQRPPPNVRRSSRSPTIASSPSGRR